MLSSQAADRMGIKGPIPERITKLSFKGEGSLWVKEQHHLPFEKLKSCSKYEYSKVGRTLGLDVYRFVTLCNDHLFYYSNKEEAYYVGYCSLENKYVHWNQIEDGRFIFLIGNGVETTCFYFQTDSFWKEQGTEIAKYAIQVDFGEQFKMGKLLGEGTFAKVFKAEEKRTHDTVTVKVIAKGPHTTPQALAEEKRLLRILHGSECAPGMVALYEQDSKYILVLEYVPGVDMNTFIKLGLDLTQEQMKQILRDVLHCILRCHRLKVWHRDIKPHNIILDEDQKPKLIDFGLATQPQHCLEQHASKCGTVGYMAPEILQSENPFCRPFSQKCDIFSFGVVAHMLLMNYHPIKGKCYEETCQLNKDWTLKLDEAAILDKHGPAGLTFLQKLLTPNPKARFSAEEALSSQFLKDQQKAESISTTEDKRDMRRGLFESV